MSRACRTLGLPFCPTPPSSSLPADLPVMSLCWMQNASLEDHDAIAAGAQLLKKLCRIKTNLSWKEWRVTMEAQRNASLQVSRLPSIQARYLLF